LVGLSSGAALAAHAAASGLPVGHLVLWEPPFRLDPEGQRESREYAERLDQLLAEGQHGDALELFMHMVGVPENAIAGMRQSPYWAAGERLAPTLAYDAAVMGDGAVPVERYAAVTAPSLVLSGGASPQWMRDSADAAGSAIPRASVRILDGQTHDVDAGLLAATVRDFVEESGRR
jgi:Alpha/beta hydrolase family